jgi:hypothetical protein
MPTPVAERELLLARPFVRARDPLTLVFLRLIGQTPFASGKSWGLFSASEAKRIPISEKTEFLFHRFIDSPRIAAGSSPGQITPNGSSTSAYP